MISSLISFIAIDNIIHFISWIFILGGSFFAFTGSMGLFRMPDFYTRLHPAGLADSIGAPLILSGFVLQEGFTLVSGKLLLLIIFFLITGPTSTHALAKAALMSGFRPEGEIDDLREEVE